MFSAGAWNRDGGPGGEKPANLSGGSMCRHEPQTVTRTKQDRRVQLVQVLTYRRSLDGITAADVARWTGLSEAECADALQREIARRAV